MSIFSRRVWAGLGLLLILTWPWQAIFANTTILYDGSIANSLPSDQAFDFIQFPGGATQTWASGATTLETVSANNISAGYFTDATGGYGSGILPVLNRASGYRVQFTAHVISETHLNNDRAGFSIIVLSHDKLGIELGFWPNEIWAQNGPPNLFTHGEGVSYTTTAGLTPYTLEMSGDTYTLTVSGSTLLTGAVRDYTSFTGFPDVYETPNFIFLGDDTTSAQAQVKISAVSVMTNTSGGGTATFTPSATATSSPTATASRTPSATASGTATATSMLTPTSTPSATATATSSPTTSRTPSATASGTATATLSLTPTFTPSATASVTPTQFVGVWRVYLPLVSK